MHLCHYYVNTVQYIILYSTLQWYIMSLLRNYCTVHYLFRKYLQYITVVHYLVRKYCTVLTSVDSNDILYNSMHLCHYYVNTVQYIMYTVQYITVLYSIYVIMTYCTTVMYCTVYLYRMSLLSTDVSTVQYLHIMGNNGDVIQGCAVGVRRIVARGARYIKSIHIDPYRCIMILAQE